MRSRCAKSQHISKHEVSSPIQASVEISECSPTLALQVYFHVSSINQPQDPLLPLPLEDVGHLLCLPLQNKCVNMNAVQDGVTDGNILALSVIIPKSQTWGLRVRESFGTPDGIGHKALELEPQTDEREEENKPWAFPIQTWSAPGARQSLPLLWQPDSTCCRSCPHGPLQVGVESRCGQAGLCLTETQLQGTT